MSFKLFNNVLFLTLLRIRSKLFSNVNSDDYWYESFYVIYVGICVRVRVPDFSPFLVIVHDDQLKPKWSRLAKMALVDFLRMKPKPSGLG